MLRQIFRQKGAYNLVNVPAVASQDDPYGNRDVGNRDVVEWRRQYAYQASQQEFRDDVGYGSPPPGIPTAYVPVYIPVPTPALSPYPTPFTCNAVEAWDRPNWWTDRQLSSSSAAKILRKRLEVYGPQREKSLQEVISRIRTEKDAVTALKTAELFQRYRSSREQHTSLKNTTSKMIIQRALEVDARDVVVKALERKDELGFMFMSLKAYRLAITHFSAKGDLENVFKVFALARKQGMKPNRDIAFCILRACLDCNRADLAHAYALEFQENGLRVSPAQKVLIEAGSGKKIPAFRGEDNNHAYEPINFNGEEEQEEVLGHADRIIAAAESDAESVSVPSPDSEVSADNISAEPENKVASEAAEASEGGSSSKVVTLVSVENSTESEAKSGAANDDSQEDRVKRLFPPKPLEKVQQLRRVHSMS